nr:VWA domain-containing protein [Flavobacterium sp. HJJ]
MDNQDKIFNKIKNASQKAEEKDFPAFEKVWTRVEEKLDKKEDKKTIILWKKLAIAASLLLFFSLGYQFFKTDSKITTPKASEENNVVIQEKEDTNSISKPSENIKPDAVTILKKQIEKQKPLVLLDTIPQTKIFLSKNASPTTEANSNVLNEMVAVENETIKKENDSVYFIKGARFTTAKDVDNPEYYFQTNKIKSIPKTETIVSKEKNSITSTYNTTTRSISGIVTDENNIPIPGANVMIKGTKQVVATDFDGKFNIKAEKGDELVFLFIGYDNKYATVEKSDILNIKMRSSTQTLNEIVVVGYGTSKKKTAVPLAKQKNKEKSNPNSKRNTTENNIGFIDEIIQAGEKEFGINNKPLLYLNGYEISKKKLNTIDFNEFETIEVIKTNDALKTFGNKGKNGVIMITSKNPTDNEQKKIEKLEDKLDEKNADYDDLDFKEDLEDYTSFIENQFESPKATPLSTFSIDVDNASYTNIRRFINDGQTVPKDAVRVEEMMNFFKYKYPQPQNQHPFSINTEYNNCPWNPNHQLLKIGLQGKNIPTDNLPASNFVFLIDVSGSMSDANKLPLLKQSMKILVNELRKKDKVAIVVYAGAAGMVLPPTAGDQKQTIIDALEKLNAGGSTAGGAGIELAYKLAEENFIKGGNNRVILATDGDFNVGATSNTDMQTLIEQKRKSGVFLTCLGYGMGNYKDSKMETLSDKGNGNYAYIDNIQEANRFLGKEFKGSMFAIAKDVKIQIEFNPKQVQAYRLIGYENRKLRPEDFTNDAIDAGELGSGHTVTALYEVIPTGVKSEFINNQLDLKYTKTSSNESDYSDELATIKFRYKKPDGNKSIEMVKVIENKSIPLKNSSDDFKFSAAVAWFGLKLRDSNLVPNKSSEDIKKLAKEGLSNDEDGYKAEFIRLVETMK